MTPDPVYCPGATARDLLAGVLDWTARHPDDPRLPEGLLAAIRRTVTAPAPEAHAAAEAARAELWSSFSPADLVRYADHTACAAAPCPVCREVVAQVLAVGADRAAAGRDAAVQAVRDLAARDWRRTPHAGCFQDAIHAIRLAAAAPDPGDGAPWDDGGQDHTPAERAAGRCGVGGDVGRAAAEALVAHFAETCFDYEPDEDIVADLLREVEAYGAASQAAARAALIRRVEGYVPVWREAGYPARADAVQHIVEVLRAPAPPDEGAGSDECDECDGSGIYTLDGQAEPCICAESQSAAPAGDAPIVEALLEVFRGSRDPCAARIEAAMCAVIRAGRRGEGAGNGE